MSCLVLLLQWKHRFHLLDLFAFWRLPKYRLTLYWKWTCSSNLRCQMLPIIKCSPSKRILASFMHLFNPVSLEDQSAQHTVCYLIETLLLLSLVKLCRVNLGLDGKGIAMSSCIGRAMHYTVTFSQSHGSQIYKCHTLFSERITGEEMDVLRHHWHQNRLY